MKTEEQHLADFAHLTDAALREMALNAPYQIPVEVVWVARELCEARQRIKTLRADLERHRHESNVAYAGYCLLRDRLRALIMVTQTTLRLAPYPPVSVASKDANDQTLHAIHKAKEALGDK